MAAMPLSRLSVALVGVIALLACSGDDDDNVGYCGSALVRVCYYDPVAKAWVRDCHMACPSNSCADGQIKQSCEWDPGKQQYTLNCVTACGGH